MNTIVEKLNWYQDRKTETISPSTLPDRSSPLSAILASLAGAYPKAVPVAPEAVYTGSNALHTPSNQMGFVIGFCTAPMSIFFSAIFGLVPGLLNLHLCLTVYHRETKFESRLVEIIETEGRGSGRRFTGRADAVATVRWILTSAWVSYLLVLMTWVPRGSRLLLDAGISKGLIATAMAWLEYIVSDGPLEREYLVFMSQLAFVLSCSITSILLYRPLWLVEWIYWIVSLAFDMFFDAIDQFGMFGYRYDAQLLYLRSMSTTLGISYWSVWKVALPLMLFLVAVLKWTDGDFTPKSIIQELVDMFRHLLQHQMRRGILPKVDLAWEYLEETMAFLLGRMPTVIDAVLDRFNHKFFQSNVSWYTYQQLQPGQIRVLVLRPSLPGTLRAELFVTNTRDAQYEAISYRWKNAAQTKTLIVNGQRLVIPRTAHQAIFARRSLWRHRVIWIDAVCINQNDGVEKAHQVLMMQEIYRDSTRVLLMVDEANWRLRVTLGLIYQHGWYPDPLTRDTLKSELIETIEYGIPIEGNQYRQLAHLLALEFWQRAWIVQELASGQTVQLYLGGHYVQWEIFAIASKMLIRFNKLTLLTRHAVSDFESGEMQFHTIHAMQQLKRCLTVPEEASPFRTPEESKKFESLLFLSVRFRATDERDKVFAFNALANDIDESRKALIRPDYTKSAESVFEDAGRYLFLNPEHPSINLLCYAGYGHASRLNRHSWAPDLTFLRRQTFTDLLSKNPRFSASGTTKPEVSEDQSSVLSVRGEICDCVHVLSSVKALALSIPGERGDDAKSALTTNLIEWFHAASDLANVLMPGPVPAGRSFEQCITAESDASITRDTIEGCFRKFENPDNRVSDTAEALFTLTNAELQVPMLISGACGDRRFGITKQGRYCLVPPSTEAGDIIAVLLGAQTPYVLRSVIINGMEFWRLIGETYTQGIMYGELVSASTRGRRFAIV